jgi:hypothetical protein
MIAIAAGIQMGASTHHHDHAIVFVSLSTIKAIVNKPQKPIPALDELLFELICNILKGE